MYLAQRLPEYPTYRLETFSIDPSRFYIEYLYQFRTEKTFLLVEVWVMWTNVWSRNREERKGWTNTKVPFTGTETHPYVTSDTYLSCFPCFVTPTCVPWEYWETTRFRFFYWQFCCLSTIGPVYCGSTLDGFLSPRSSSLTRGPVVYETIYCVDTKVVVLLDKCKFWVFIGLQRDLSDIDIFRRVKRCENVFVTTSFVFILFTLKNNNVVTLKTILGPTV